MERREFTFGYIELDRSDFWSTRRVFDVGALPEWPYLKVTQAPKSRRGISIPIF